MSEFQSDCAEIIEGVAETIERDGWHRGALYGPGSSVCILGGFQKVQEQLGLTAFDGRLSQAKRKVEEIISLETHHRGDSIPWWNDRIAESREEVIELLRAAAEDVRSDWKYQIDDGTLEAEIWDDIPDDEDEPVATEIEVEEGFFEPAPDFVPDNLLETAVPVETSAA